MPTVKTPQDEKIRTNYIRDDGPTCDVFTCKKRCNFEGRRRKILVTRFFKKTKRGTPKWKQVQNKGFSVANEFTRVRSGEIVNEGTVYLDVRLEGTEELQIRLSEEETRKLVERLKTNIVIIESRRSGELAKFEK